MKHFPINMEKKRLFTAHLITARGVPYHIRYISNQRVNNAKYFWTSLSLKHLGVWEICCIEVPHLEAAP